MDQKWRGGDLIDFSEGFLNGKMVFPLISWPNERERAESRDFDFIMGCHFGSQFIDALDADLMPIWSVLRTNKTSNWHLIVLISFRILEWTKFRPKTSQITCSSLNSELNSQFQLDWWKDELISYESTEWVQCRSQKHVSTSQIFHSQFW